MTSIQVPGPQYNNVVFHHVPNHQAPGLLAAMLVFAFCLGVITLEIMGNLRYDYNLLKRPGWKEPLKACNRIAYLVCRYACFVFMLITVIYMNLPGSNCEAYAIGINVMWVIPLITVDLIFVQRTLAVYNWNLFLVLPLSTIYLAYVGMCTYSVVKFGYGYRIPGSEFCAYQTISTHIQPHASLFIVYITLVIVLDTLILLLTTHRLIEGGLGNVFHLIVTKTSELRKNKAQRKAEGHQVGEVSLSGLLLRQGVGYFLCLEISRLAFLIVYYTVNNQTSYQVLVSGILVLVGPLMAGMLFRQTSEAVKRTAGATSSSGRGNDNILSQGRSYRSSLGTNPANFTPFTPLSPISPHFGGRGESTRNLTSNHAPTGLFSPSYPLKNGSPGQDTIGTEYFENGLSRNGSIHSPANGAQEDPKGLQVYVEEKTDVESVAMSPLGGNTPTSPNNNQGRFTNLTSIEEGLPIHHQFSSSRSNPSYFASSQHAQQMSSPNNDQSNLINSFTEDDVTFTPVLPSSNHFNDNHLY